MELGWLPYGRQRPGAGNTSDPRLPRALPLLVRPPTTWIRSAVAIPATLVVFLLSLTTWSLLVDAAPPAHTYTTPDSDGPPLLPALPAAFPAPVRYWEDDIFRWASENHLTPEFVAVVMTLESCGDPAARSGAGARGLFQVMPFHFVGGEDPDDPEVNARRGLAYLSQAMQLASGEPSLALAGYNGGHGLITRDSATWPAETARYVRWGTGILRDIEAGSPRSPTLDAWLASGGASLCRAAEVRLS